MSEPRRYWLVVRTEWYVWGRSPWMDSYLVKTLGEPEGLGRHTEPPGSGLPVKLFTDPDRAAADARRRELIARQDANPFRCNLRVNNPPDVSSLDDARMHDWCLDAGLTPPPEGVGRRAWGEWWEMHAPTMSDDQRSRVWEACDRVRFFEVIEIDGPAALPLVGFTPPAESPSPYSAVTTPEPREEFEDEDEPWNEESEEDDIPF